MTKPQDIQAALDALDLLQKRAYSHAEKSNGPKEMRDWIDSDAEKIRAVLKSAAKDIENPTNLCMSEKHIQKNQENYTGTRDIQEAIRFFENPAVKMDRLTRMHYEVLKEAAQSHAPAHDAVDLEAIKRELRGVIFPYIAVEKVIDHLAPRLARSVPDKATINMINAGHAFILEEQIKDNAPDVKKFCAELYEAMLSAAPQQKKGE